MMSLWTLLAGAIISNAPVTRDCLVARDGQWAETVLEFSSEYSSNANSAQQVLGPCDTFRYGDSSTAWAAKEANLASGEYISVGFKNAVHATGAIIRETFGSGFVTRVEMINVDNAYYVVWEGEDQSPPGEVNDLQLSWRATSDLIKGMRITTDPTHSDSWEEIDSIQLVGDPQ